MSQHGPRLKHVSNTGRWGLRTSGRHSSNQACCGRLSLRYTAREVSDDAWCAAHCGSCCAQACQVLSERIVFVAVHTHTATAADATAPVTPAHTHPRSNAEHSAHFNSSRNCSNSSNGTRTGGRVGRTVSLAPSSARLAPRPVRTLLIEERIAAAQPTTVAASPCSGRLQRCATTQPPAAAVPSMRPVARPKCGTPRTARTQGSRTCCASCGRSGCRPRCAVAWSGGRPGGPASPARPTSGRESRTAARTRPSERL